MGVLVVLCPTYIQECLFNDVCPCTWPSHQYQVILLLECGAFWKIKEKKYKRNINNNLAVVASYIPVKAVHDSQAADSSLGVGLLRLFPSLRAHIGGGTFIDNHMRWCEQGLLWGIDSSGYGHYSTSWAWYSRTQLDSSLSWALGVLIVSNQLRAAVVPRRDLGGIRIGGTATRKSGW